LIIDVVTTEIVIRNFSIDISGQSITSRMPAQPCHRPATSSSCSRRPILAQ
jgi:hypothetical protein